MISSTALLLAKKFEYATWMKLYTFKVNKYNSAFSGKYLGFIIGSLDLKLKVMK